MRRSEANLPFHGFPSALYHRSGSTNNLVVKLVLFYKVTMKESGLEQDKPDQASVKQDKTAEAAEEQPPAGSLTSSSEPSSSTPGMKTAVEVNSERGERDETSGQEAIEAPEGDKTNKEGEDAAVSAQDDAQNKDKAVSPVLSSTSASAPAPPAVIESVLPFDASFGFDDQGNDGGVQWGMFDNPAPAIESVESAVSSEPAAMTGWGSSDISPAANESPPSSSMMLSRAVGSYEPVTMGSDVLPDPTDAAVREECRPGIVKQARAKKAMKSIGPRRSKISSIVSSDKP